MENKDNTISARGIWVRYTLIITISATLIAVFLYFVQDQESRFRLGSLLLPVLALLIGFGFDYKLPKERENLELLLIGTDIGMFIFGAILFWLIVQEVNIPKERVYAIVGNYWAWLCVWGIIATSRLKMALQSVSLVQTGKALARSHA